MDDQDTSPKADDIESSAEQDDVAESVNDSDLAKKDVSGVSYNGRDDTEGSTRTTALNEVGDTLASLGVAQSESEQEGDVPKEESVAEAPVAMPQVVLKSRRRMLPIVLAIVVFVVGLLAIIYFFSSRQSVSPEQAFEDMLKGNLRTKSVTQNYNIVSSLANATINFDSDFSDPSMPRTSGAVHMTISFVSDIMMAFDIVSIADDAYVRYTDITVPDLSDEDATKLDPILNKWAPLIEDGRSVLTSDIAGADELVKGLNTVLGEVIIGNFSDEQASEIYAALSDGVYTYDAAAVTSEHEDGVAVYRYEVTQDYEKLKAANLKAAEYAGVNNPDDYIEAIFSGDAQSIVFWIAKDTRRLVKVETGSSDSAMLTISYSNYDAQTAIEAPETEITPEQFKSLSTNLLGT